MTNYYNCTAEEYRKALHHKIMYFGLMSLPAGWLLLLMDGVTMFTGNKLAIDLFIPMLVIWIATPFICLTIWAYYDFKLAKTKDQLRQEGVEV